jgi:hypothetical protein
MENEMKNRNRKIVIGLVGSVVLMLAIIIAYQRAASAADEREQAIAVATDFANSHSPSGAPVLASATKGGTELLVALRADVPPDLVGKQFWVVTFAGDFAPLRPLPPGTSVTGAPKTSAHSLTLYVLEGKVVGGHGGTP